MIKLNLNLLNRNFLGHIDHLTVEKDSVKISGWIKNKENKAFLYINDSLVGNVSGDYEREDLISEGIGGGNLAFSQHFKYILPDNFVFKSAYLLSNNRKRKVKLTNISKVDLKYYLQNEVSFDNKVNLTDFRSDIVKGKIVVFFPDYSATNHYQSLLYKASQEDGNISIINGSLSVANQYIKNNNDVIFHIHWTSPILGSAKSNYEADEHLLTFKEGIFEFISLGGKIFWTIHNVVPHNNKFEAQELLLREFLNQVSSKIHLHSETHIADIERHYSIDSSKVVILPHGNFIDVFENTITREEARDQMGYFDTDIVLLFLGQIKPYKDLENLIDKFDKLSKNNNNIKLLIVGKCGWPYKQGQFNNLSQIYSKIKIVDEFIPDDKMQLYFNCADLYCATYKKILTSGSIFGALSFNIPVIAPALGGIPDIVNSENGYLYNAQIENSFYEVLTEAVSDIETGNRKENVSASIKELRWEEISRSQFSEFNKLFNSKLNITRFENTCYYGKIPCAVIDNKSGTNKPTAIFVLNYECLEDTRRLIQSIKTHLPNEYDIYLVDNNSEETSLKLLAKIFHDVTIIKSSKNLGYAAGNNIAFRFIESKGYEYENYWILNPDCEITHDVHSQYLDSFRENDLEIVGALITKDNGNLVDSAGGLVDFTFGLKINTLYSGDPVNTVEDKLHKVDYISGASLFFKKSFLEKNGFIPESYFLYFEETDWFQSFKNKKTKLFVDTSIKILHHKSSISNAVPTKAYFYYYIRNAILFTKKFQGKKVENTVLSLQQNFINPWLEKIAKKRPSSLEKYKFLAQIAVKHAIKDVKGEVQLDILLAEHLSKYDIEGNIDSVTDCVVEGWAYNKNHNKPISIEIVLNDITIGIIKADRKRSDLSNFKKGSSSHGFRFEIPKNKIIRGKEFKLEIFDVQSGTPLRSLNEGFYFIAAIPPKYTGRIEGITGNRILGWIWNENQVNEKTDFEMFVNGKYIGSSTANIFRKDLSKHGISDGRAGFSIPFSMKELYESAVDSLEIELFVKGSKKLIANKSIERKRLNINSFEKNDSIDSFLKWTFVNPENYYSNSNIINIKNKIISYTRILAKTYSEVLEMEKVSIIMPTFNRAEVILDAVNSVVNQTYTNWELIIIDDGSEDDTIGILKEHYGDLKKLVIIECSKNKGVSYARNVGLERASGDVIAYLDTDNKWDTEYLNVSVNHMNKYGFSSAYSFQDVHQYYAEGGLVRSEPILLRGGVFNLSLIENKNYIDLNVFIHKKALYKEHGGFNQNLKRLVDWDLILRYSRITKPIFIPAILSSYSVSKTNNQITATENFQQNFNILRKESIDKTNIKETERTVNKRFDIILDLMGQRLTPLELEELVKDIRQFYKRNDRLVLLIDSDNEHYQIETYKGVILFNALDQKSLEDIIFKNEVLYLKGALYLDYNWASKVESIMSDDNLGDLTHILLPQQKVDSTKFTGLKYFYKNSGSIDVNALSVRNLISDPMIQDHKNYLKLHNLPASMQCCIVSPIIASTILADPISNVAHSLNNVISLLGINIYYCSELIAREKYLN